jgi:predicted SAM-dependent methyltransferase
MRINLGCGQDKRPGYVNVDVRRDVDPDLVWDLEKTPYPFDSESADEVLMKDSLEHVSWRKVEDVIRECHRVLRKGGVLRIQAPDLEAIARKVILSGIYDWSEISYWIYGSQDYPENTHRAGFTIPILKRLLERHGFIVDDIYNDGGTNAHC